MAEQAPEALWPEGPPEAWVQYMLGYLGSSKCRIQGTGSSVRVEVTAPQGAEHMRAAAGGVGRMCSGVWTTEGPEQVQALASWILSAVDRFRMAGCPASSAACKMQKAAAAAGA